MPTTVKFRRGTTAQNDAFTGAAGEITIDEDLDTVVVHDGSSVTLTQYGTLKSTSLATFDADINGSDLRLRCTPASNASTVIKLDRTTVDA